jgi:hypothetical protein
MKGVNDLIGRRISIRRNGDMVRLQIYDCRDSHEKYFDAEAPANDPAKVRLLLEAAFSKGLIKPKFDDEEKWW